MHGTGIKHTMRFFRKSVWWQKKIRHINSFELDSSYCEEPGGVWTSDILANFPFMLSEDGDRILGMVRPISCMLKPGPAWLIKAHKLAFWTGYKFFYANGVSASSLK